MANAPDQSLEKLVRVFIKMRDKKAEIEGAAKTQAEAIEEQMKLVKAQMLKHCKDHEVDSVRTAAGTIIRTVKTNYWTSDWEAMHKFIIENEVPDFLQKRLNQSAVVSFLEEHPDTVPPALNTNSEYVITVRKA